MTPRAGRPLDAPGDADLAPSAGGAPPPGRRPARPPRPPGGREHRRGLTASTQAALATIERLGPDHPRRARRGRAGAAAEHDPHRRPGSRSGATSTRVVDAADRRVVRVRDHRRRARAARAQPHPQGRVPRRARRRAHRRRARAARRRRCPLLEASAGRLPWRTARGIAASTFRSMHDAQLPAVLHRPAHLAVRHVDADDRARLAGAAPLAQQRRSPSGSPSRCSSCPRCCFGVWGGVIADRFDKRMVLRLHAGRDGRRSRCCSRCSTLTGVVAALDALRDRVPLRASPRRSTTPPASRSSPSSCRPGRPPERDRAQQRDLPGRARSSAPPSPAC